MAKVSRNRYSFDIMRQHFIPRLHLRTFGVPIAEGIRPRKVGVAVLNNDGSVHEFGKVRLDSVAARCDMYEKHSKTPLRLEHLLSHIEGEAGNPFAMLNDPVVNGKLIMPGKASTALSNYLMVLYLRHPLQLSQQAGSQYMAELFRKPFDEVEYDLQATLELLLTRRMSVTFTEARITTSSLPVILPIDNPIHIEGHTMTVALTPNMLLTAHFVITPWIRDKPLPIKVREDDGTAVTAYLRDSYVDSKHRSYVYEFAREREALDFLSQLSGSLVTA